MNDHALPSSSPNATGAAADEESLRESEARLKLALDAARMGAWDWNMRTGKIHWSPQHEVLFGYAPGTPHRTYADFQQCLRGIAPKRKVGP